jgi:hypothetical protein
MNFYHSCIGDPKKDNFSLGVCAALWEFAVLVTA